jgi:hypothetical protein
MIVPSALESELLEAAAVPGETVVAFALLPRAAQPASKSIEPDPRMV